MIELTSVDMMTGEKLSKLAIIENRIISVEEVIVKKSYEKEGFAYTNVCIEINGSWKDYSVFESYDRVLRLAKL